VGRRTERPGVVCDLSPTGAMVELDKWLPLGTLLHLTFPAANDSALVTVVRSTLSDDFTRRYGVACLHSELPFADLYSASESLGEDDDLPCPIGLQWPAARSDIRRIYRTLARKMHPDVGGTDARFRTLHQAYLDAMAVAAR
jgi:hypothetical protein